MFRRAGHLEEVALEPTEAGIVVTTCSRFCPNTAVACSRECARRLDRRAGYDVDRRERVLVVYEGKQPQTAITAEALARLLGADELLVELADADAVELPPPADYDAVVIGSAHRHGWTTSPLTAYVRAYRDVLAAQPSFLFAVGAAPDAHVAELIRETAWQPTDRAALEGPGAPTVHELAARIADQIPAAYVVPRII